MCEEEGLNGYFTIHLYKILLIIKKAPQLDLHIMIYVYLHANKIFHQLSGSTLPEKPMLDFNVFNWDNKVQCVRFVITEGKEEGENILYMLDYYNLVHCWRNSHLE